MADINYDFQQVMSPHADGVLGASEQKSFENTIVLVSKNVPVLQGSINFQVWFENIRELLILQGLWSEYVSPEDDKLFMEVKLDSNGKPSAKA